MGGCVGKPGGEAGHGSPHGAPGATVEVYSSKAFHQPHQLRDKQLLPALPDTPLKGYTIPAGPGRISREDVSVPAAAPSPISKAPAGIAQVGRPELPYAAPYIPPPSLPPPEYPDLPAEPSWQPGRKRAVLVGVNYARCSDERWCLRGCVNDMHCLKHLLMTKYGFQSNSIVLLHDEQPHEDYWPTQENILAAVRWLVGGCQAPDSLVFAFSGHGSLDAADALEGRDGILPCDFEQAGPLYDAALYDALVAPLPAGSRLHCLVDACKGVFALGLPSCVYTRADGWSNWEEDERVLEEGGGLRRLASLRPRRGGEVVMLSSTLSEEDVSDDDDEDGGGGEPDRAAYAAHASTGAVSFSLIQAVEQGQASTYNVLLRAMRYSLKNGPQHFPKVPELSASHDFDLNRPFLL